MVTRLSKDAYYAGIARQVSLRSSCLRKQWGAVIVNNDEIISTGYNGSPRKTVNCSDLGECYRIAHNIPRGTNYNACRSVHAEQNAIISAARKDMIGSTMYLYGYDVENSCDVKNPNSCVICRRMIINAGIIQLVIITGVDADKNLILKRINVNLDWVEHDDELNELNGY